MSKKSGASILTLILVALSPPLHAQDGSGEQRSFQPLSSSENLSEALDAPDYFVRDAITAEGDNLGDHIAIQNVDMGAFNITNMADPTEDQDAATKWYVDQAVGAVSGPTEGDNLGDHVATTNLNMSHYNINNSKIINPKIYNGESWDLKMWDPRIFDAYIKDADISDASIRDPDVSGGTHNHGVFSNSTMHLMTADFLTTFNGWTVWNNTIDMQGNDIKNAKIKLQLDMDNSPLINVPDPVNPQDAVNLRTLDSRIASGGGDNLGDHKAIQTLDMGGFTITNIPEPTDPGDVTTKTYVDTAVAGAGDNLGDHKATQKIDMASNSLVNLSDPVNPQDAVNLRTLDSKIIAASAGDNLGDHKATQKVDMGGFTVANLPAPAQPGDAATKAYVDAAVGGAGDDLGSHKATQGVNMSGFKISNVSNPVNAKDAVNLETLDSKIAAASAAGGDDLGNHKAAQNIDAAGFKLINVADPALPTEAVNLRTLDSKITASGGDNMGDHTATQDLDMASFNINDANIQSPNIFWGQAQDLELTRGKLNDMFGDNNEFWNTTSYQSSINDATINNSNINAPHVSLLTANDLTTFNGWTVWNNTIDMQGNHIKNAKIGDMLDMDMSPLVNVPDPVNPLDAVNLQTLDSKIAAVGGGGGDNLGDHTATTDLDMALFNVNNAKIQNPKVYDGESWDLKMWDPKIYTAYIKDADISDANISDPVVSGGTFNAPHISHATMDLMTANYMTVFNGHTFFNENIDMQGHGIKNARIKTQLNMDWMPLINVPDPVDEYDAVNLRTLEAQIASVSGGGSGPSSSEFSDLQDLANSNKNRVGSLEGRVWTLENSGGGGGGGGASQADVDKNTQDISGLRGDHDNLRNWVAYIDGEFWGLKSRVDSNQGQISGLDGNMTYALQEIEALKDRIATLEGKH